MCQCIAQTDPTFETDVVRKVVLSFCVQGCYYTFTTYCGQMDEKRLVTLLASIARARSGYGCNAGRSKMVAACALAIFRGIIIFTSG